MLNIKSNFSMKKFIYLVSGLFILIGCSQNPVKTEGGDHNDHDQATINTELTLNNGSKWKADSITNHNVMNLKTTADNFRIKPFPSATDYQLVGNDLNAGVNKLIGDCKMSGPDHDALHHWLEPVLRESNDLKSSKDTAAARATFESLDKRIDDYHKYFE